MEYIEEERGHCEGGWTSFWHTSLDVVARWKIPCPHSHDIQNLVLFFSPPNPSIYPSIAITPLTLSVCVLFDSPLVATLFNATNFFISSLLLLLHLLLFFLLISPHSFEIPPHSTDSCDSSPLSLYFWRGRMGSPPFCPTVDLWIGLLEGAYITTTGRSIWPWSPPRQRRRRVYILCAHCFGRHLTSLVIQFPISRAQNELGTTTPASPATCTAQAMTRKVDDGQLPTQR